MGLFCLQWHRRKKSVNTYFHPYCMYQCHGLPKGAQTLSTSLHSKCYCRAGCVPGGVGF